VHKGLMASTIFQFWNSAISSKPLNIYYALGKPKGSQSRDFISVDQVVQVIDLILSSRKPLIGIFNCGSGSRINFLELAKGIIDISNSRSMIEFVEMPKEIEKHYQWQTQANIGKLKSHLNWDIGGDLMSEIKRIYGKSLDESI
jgi:nucleoside-diphosphate-sugar epimerase